MNLAQEIERLAKLHAEGALSQEEFAFPRVFSVGDKTSSEMILLA